MATRSRPEPHRAGSLDALVSAREIVITCGSGGVGKTTTAAAIAAQAAVYHGGRVLVVTVDPARRLASALGFDGPDPGRPTHPGNEAPTHLGNEARPSHLGNEARRPHLGNEARRPHLGSETRRPHLGNEARRVPAEAFTAAGVEPRGELWAAMLDTKQSWDDLVRRHAPDRQTAARIIENPLYQNIAGKFVQSHDYIAMERLYELHVEGRYDLIVVDTPPTRNAIDFIEAPERMAEFFSSRLLRLLIGPYRNRFVNLASRPFYQIADRILGSQFLADIAEFFILFQTMYEGFVTRARAVERLLEDRRTTFVVVSTLDAAAAREAESFVQLLAAKRFPVGALVLNRVLPDYLRDSEAARAAGVVVEHARPLANRLAGEIGTDGDQLERVLLEIGDNFLNFRVVAGAEAAQREELSAVPDVVATVPEFDTDIHDVAGVLRLGAQIWG